jgi:hypothetical protein
MDREEPHPSNYRGCSHAKEEMQKRKLQKAPKTTMGRVFSFIQITPGLFFMVVLHSDSQQQQQPQLPSVEQACPATMGEMRHSQQVPSQSVQVPNANSSSVNDIFKVVTTIVEQIIRELSGAKSEEDRTMAITKILLKLMKQNSH